jgi:hypothetical protein
MNSDSLGHLPLSKGRTGRKPRRDAFGKTLAKSIILSQGGIIITDLIRFSFEISIGDRIRIPSPCLSSLLPISRAERKEEIDLV